MGIGLTDGTFAKGFNDNKTSNLRSHEYETNTRNSLLSSNDLTKKIQFEPKYQKEVENFFSYPVERRIVLLQSVRSAGNELPEFITKFIKAQKKENNLVYIPKFFNFQKDNTGGIVICNTMRYVIRNSIEATIAYNPESEGTKFDYGMVLYNGISTKLLNTNLNIDDQVYVSMKGELDKDSELHDSIGKMWDKIYASKKIPLKLEYVERPPKDGKTQPAALSPLSAINFGMVYASEYPFKLMNPDEVKAQSVLEDKLGFFKSYSKVALKLHEIYDG